MLAATRKKLETVSTATIATCLFKLGFRNQFIQEVRPLRPRSSTMVGEAFTLRYIPAREDLNSIKVFQDPKHPQRAAVESCPQGAVMVIDSRKDCRAASAGSIYSISPNDAWGRRYCYGWWIQRFRRNCQTSYTLLS